MLRLSGFRLVIMGVAVLWFGYFSMRVLIAYSPSAVLMTKPVRLRLLLAVVIWLALILQLVELVELVA